MRPQIVAILAIVLSLLNGTVMHAQSADTPPPPPPTPPPELPLDSGIIVLLLAGLIYGTVVVARRLRPAKTRS